MSSMNAELTRGTSTEKLIPNVRTSHGGCSFIFNIHVTNMISIMISVRALSLKLKSISA
jgi:hypothetical protein